MMIALLAGLALGAAGPGCGRSGASRTKKNQLTKKSYGARLDRCKTQLQAAHLAEILRWMKEKAETKALAAGVDKLAKHKTSRAIFDDITAKMAKAYRAVVDGYPSEEAFQKAVKDGPHKEAATCFKQKACADFAGCVSTAVTGPLLAVSGNDKHLLKLVTKPSLHDQMMATTSLSRAITLARKAITDEHGKLSKGAALLALWAARKGLKVGQIKALPESGYKSVMKDSDEERGRYICTRGKLIQIHAEKTAYGKIYPGGMFMGWGYSKVARFVAVGSSRGINQGSRARFCGVVIGRYSYSNSGGGTTHAVQLVGVFDIAENR
jgi:hypothetical protein